MDILAYFQLYRWWCQGEWVYVNDSVMGVCHWTRPTWLKENRFLYQYKVLDYQNF